jgi:hypothetical protein
MSDDPVSFTRVQTPDFKIEYLYLVLSPHTMRQFKAEELMN